MTLARFTRYTLRLEAPARTVDGVSAPAAGASSGAAPHGPGWGAQALDYVDPEAVDEVLALQPAGWQEQDDGRTLVFWMEDGAEADPAVTAALRRLGALGRLEVERERPDWEDAWRRFHKPHEIGRLYVRPPWYPAREGFLDVAVEAGLAFGTGSHASTRQCLELIQTIAPGALLDLGCGSGVIALAALRLGFTPVVGVDVDPVAVRVAAGNASLNCLAPTLLVGDATDRALELPSAGVVVANISLRPILRLARRWGESPSPPVVRPGSTGVGADHPPAELVLSGLLVGQAGEVLAAYPAYVERARRDDGEWLTLHLSRRP